MYKGPVLYRTKVKNLKMRRATKVFMNRLKPNFYKVTLARIIHSLNL